LVDKDPGKFAPALPVDWKAKHEAFVATEGGVPALPSVILETRTGLTLPSTGSASLSGADFEVYRKHELVIAQDSGRMVHPVACRIQFPEPVVQWRLVEKPLGTSPECKPDQMEWVGNATGSGSVSISGTSRGAMDFKVGIDRLPPGQPLLVRFISQKGERDGAAIESWREGTIHHIIGSFQYEFLGQYQKREFFIALKFDQTTRRIRSDLPVDYERASIELRQAKKPIVVRASW
jgi:hypothetical protein